MSWFTYQKNSSSTFAPVRREIVFPNLTENLASGDWLHVNIGSLDVGRLYYFDQGLIKNKIDTDSYLVVYETATSFTPTYSAILNGNSSNQFERNLWFKSVSTVAAGNQPDGKYYIYYHKDDIQYIELQSNNYVSTTPPSGNNFMALETGSLAGSINFYSVSASGNSSNARIAAISFLGDLGTWQDQTSSSVGAKAIGTFSGPNFKLYAKKGPDCGKIRLKVTKTSAVGEGQKVIKSDVIIDLYSPTNLSDQNIYTLNIQSENIFFTYDELYGDFSFEIEILGEKNQASSGTKCSLERYTFSKVYDLSLDDEEIKPDIAFKSIGGLK